VISTVSPNSFAAGSAASAITVSGSGFTTSSSVEWNGAPLTTSYSSIPNSSGVSAELIATVPAADLVTPGAASITVNTPDSNPPLSNTVTVDVDAPVPTLSSVYPNAGPINTPAAVTLTGTGFVSTTSASVNGVTIPGTVTSSTEISSTIPASSLSLPGNLNIAVTTPSPGGGTSASLLFTAYISIAANDIVYNPSDGLLYASVLSTGIGTGGNTVVGIDPVTGIIMRQILTVPSSLHTSSGPPFNS
jgi:trimeric autotransporter adhesin